MPCLVVIIHPHHSQRIGAPAGPTPIFAHITLFASAHAGMTATAQAMFWGAAVGNTSGVSGQAGCLPLPAALPAPLDRSANPYIPVSTVFQTWHFNTPGKKPPLDAERPIFFYWLIERSSILAFISTNFQGKSSITD